MVAEDQCVIKSPNKYTLVQSLQQFKLTSVRLTYLGVKQREKMFISTDLYLIWLYQLPFCTTVSMGLNTSNGWRPKTNLYIYIHNKNVWTKSIVNSIIMPTTTNNIVSNCCVCIYITSTNQTLIVWQNTKSIVLMFYLMRCFYKS